jgi:hypothetical protein
MRRTPTAATGPWADATDDLLKMATARSARALVCRRNAQLAGAGGSVTGCVAPNRSPGEAVDGAAGPALGVGAPSTPPRCRAGGPAVAVPAPVPAGTRRTVPFESRFQLTVIPRVVGGGGATSSGCAANGATATRAFVLPPFACFRACAGRASFGAAAFFGGAGGGGTLGGEADCFAGAGCVAAGGFGAGCAGAGCLVGTAAPQARQNRAPSSSC